MAEAEALYAEALAAEGLEQAERFRKVQTLLDRIASEHPASDAAVLLLLDLPIGNVDPARVREGMGEEIAEPAAAPDAAEPHDQQDLASMPAGQDGVAALVAEAEALYAAALAADGPEQVEGFRKIQFLLDRIASEHPASNEAVQLMLDLPIGIVDPTRVREGVAAAVAPPGAAPDTPGPDGEQDLASLMATCFAGVDPGSAVRGDLQITVAAEVGSTGDVVGLPALVAPASVDADARRLFQRALSAIDACAPFGDEVRNRKLTAVFSAQGLVSVAVGVEPPQDVPKTIPEEPAAATASGTIERGATLAVKPPVGSDLSRERRREISGQADTPGL